MDNNELNKPTRSSQEIRQEIEQLEAQKRALEEMARQTMQSQIEQQQDDLTNQIIDSMNDSSTLGL